MILKDVDKNWMGSIEELSALAVEALRENEIGQADFVPSVRLIRDYTARGILSRPKRIGKEAKYGFRQLIELVAGRKLVAAGWPLQKIAEDFSRSSPEEIQQVVDEHRQENQALDLVQSYRSMPMDDVDAPQMQSSAPPPRNDAFMARSRKDLSYSSRMQEFEKSDSYLSALKDFDGDLYSVIKQDMTAFQLASWLVLFVDQARCQSLKRQEIEEIGEAVKTALLNRANVEGRY